MVENVRIFETTAMTFVVKLDPPGPFLINLLVDVAAANARACWNSKNIFASETVNAKDQWIVIIAGLAKRSDGSTHLSPMERDDDR